MAWQRTRFTRFLAAFVAALVVLVVGILLGGHPSVLPGFLRSSLTGEQDGQFVHGTLNILTSQYYRPLNRNALVNQALAGAVASLGDPYSHYYSPSEYREFEQQTSPHLSGVGIDVLPQAQGLRVVDVFPGTPAARAGITAGDIILAVGGQSLAGRAQNAPELITGPVGTPVTLTVQEGAARRKLTLRRADVLVSTGGILDFHGVKLGDVRLTAFVQGAGTDVRVQVDKVLSAGARGIILDLRDNGGGLLEEAVNVASIFIPDGTIVSTAGRSQPREVYLSKGGSISDSIPVVVLVDSGTASAAEIVTGALKDRGRATVVGTHTYGKGVFQEVQPLSNGGALDITVGEYFTPSGQNLGGGGVRQGAGIKPDVYAQDNPHTIPDEALEVAERVLAAKLR
jgi:carboxyl-terminal processing protease